MSRLSHFEAASFQGHVEGSYLTAMILLYGSEELGKDYRPTKPDCAATGRQVGQSVSVHQCTIIVVTPHWLYLGFKLGAACLSCPGGGAAHLSSLPHKPGHPSPHTSELRGPHQSHAVPGLPPPWRGRPGPTPRHPPASCPCQGQGSQHEQIFTRIHTCRRRWRSSDRGPGLVETSGRTIPLRCHARGEG